MQAGAQRTLRAAEAGVGATVGLAAKGLLPDSSVPSSSARGPVVPVQEAAVKDVVAAQRAIDPISQTALPGVPCCMSLSQWYCSNSGLLRGLQCSWVELSVAAASLPQLPLAPES